MIKFVLKNNEILYSKMPPYIPEKSLLDEMIDRDDEEEQTLPLPNVFKEDMIKILEYLHIEPVPLLIAKPLIRNSIIDNIYSDLTKELENYILSLFPNILRINTLAEETKKLARFTNACNYLCIDNLIKICCVKIGLLLQNENLEVELLPFSKMKVIVSILPQEFKVGYEDIE
jgi:hypothetical protein